MILFLHSILFAEYTETGENFCLAHSIKASKTEPTLPWLGREWLYRIVQQVLDTSTAFQISMALLS